MSSSYDVLAAIDMERVAGHPVGGGRASAGVADITFLTAGQCWLYLAVLMDGFSRRIVGWALSERIDEALTQAYAARRMAEGRTRSEITRCLKRYIAREVYSLLMKTGALGRQTSVAA